ncbi:MAG TPA: chemotaxis response regulator protein-glutamate methylesterase, partial [bacterium]|nr:chemotaxis response regulator protein-glutamate methylesterase [bacterium]
IVDDSALMRKVLRDMLESDGEFEVVGTARDGADAVLKARELKPDVVTMDINMPNLDGLTSLQYIVNEKICPVVMVSSLTTENSITTFEAIELGAFDYVAKPGGTVSAKMDSVAAELKEKLKAAVKSKNKFQKRSLEELKKERKQKFIKKSSDKTEKKIKYTGELKAVVIGISTGGPRTIFDVVPYLRADLNAVYFLIQHMPPNFTKSYAERLNNNSELDVKEAAAADVVAPGKMFVGKGGYHLTLHKKLDNTIIIRTPSTPQHLFMPSVDICMESVLEIFGKNTIGVLMTGMGEDGAKAMVKIRQAGGWTIAESEETAIVFGMPARAIEYGGADIVLPSYKIAAAINEAIQKTT